MSFFISRTPSPPRFSLFPYTTLFRSRQCLRCGELQNRASPRVHPRRAPHRHDTGRGEALLGFHLVQYRGDGARSEEHTSELQSRPHLVCRLLLEKKKKQKTQNITNNY